MLADLNVTNEGNDEIVTIALQNGKKIVGCVKNRDSVEITENTTIMSEENAEIAAMMALALKHEIGESYVVWRHLVENVERYKKESAKARLFIN
jgi:hypothetical protein